MAETALTPIPTNNLCDRVFEQWYHCCTEEKMWRAVAPFDLVGRLTDATDAERDRALRVLVHILERGADADGRSWTRAERARVLEELIRLDPSDDALRSRIVRAVAGLGLRGRVVARFFRHALADRADKVRAEALRAVAKDPWLVGEGHVANHLLHGLKDTSRHVRVAAASCVGLLEPRPLVRIAERAGDELVRLLLHLVEQDDPRLAVEAACAVAILVRFGCLDQLAVVAYFEVRPISRGAAVLLCLELGATSTAYLMRAVVSRVGCRAAIAGLIRRGPAALAGGLDALERANRQQLAAVLSDEPVAVGPDRRVWREALRLLKAS